MQTLSAWKSHGGTQGVHRHASRETGTPMTFAAFVPDHAPGERLPVLWWLSGLTCTHANVMEKGEYRAACAEHRLILIAPDTSPRGPATDGTAVPDDLEGAYDFGFGAGFYLDATEAPFAANYRMESYVVDELPGLAAEVFPIDLDRQAVAGHSMGGHGALTLALRHPGRFASVSAFAPICAPSEVPWGRKAFAGYLGADEARWRSHDAVALVEDGGRLPALRVDQGTADEHLATQLRPDRLKAACGKAGQPLELHLRDGYDHSYFFVSTFMAEHVAWHAGHLRVRRA